MSATELRASETLLDKGVALQCVTPFLFRLFLPKKITLYNPTLYTLLKISNLALEMKADGKISEMGSQKKIEQFANHGEKLAQIIALAMLRNKWKQRFFTGIVARWISEKMDVKTCALLVDLLVLQGGVEDFYNIIASVESLSITTPKTSQAPSHTS